jgi:hypothetical protein
MLEVMTPEMTARYVEITSPEFLAKAFQGVITPTISMTDNLNLVG